MYTNRMKKEMYIGILRICMGWIFLWAFMDKLLGLGFATTPQKAWIVGVSPTYAFLKFGTYGPFKQLFENVAGSFFVDWLFMLGLLGVGVALLLGIAKKLSTLSGCILLLLMWVSMLPSKNNPLVDEHIIYILVLQLLLQLRSGEIMGLGKWWDNTTIVKKFPLLK